MRVEREISLDLEKFIVFISLSTLDFRDWQEKILFPLSIFESNKKKLFLLSIFDTETLAVFLDFREFKSRV